MSVQHDPRLTAYALGELSLAEARELETSLERDARARAEVAAIREAASWLASELHASSPPALSMRRRASILAAAARGAAPLEAPAASAQRRRSWVLLAALALPAVAALVMLQHQRSPFDGTSRDERARRTADVAAERTSDPRAPSPRSAASSDVPMPAEPEPGTPPEALAEGLAAPRSDVRTPERAARPSEHARADEQGLAIGGDDALAREDDEGEADDDIGAEGGFVGGVVGGVVGELVGGTAPPPPTSSARPKQLTARAGQSLLAIDPNVSPYKVDLPEEYVQRSEEYHATISICVASDGSVSSVEVLKPSIPIIDRRIPKVIPLWKYHPYLVDGKPTPFCYGTNYRVVRGP